jgi:tRNA (Thr-GGU) A37 N-methylase
VLRLHKVVGNQIELEGVDMLDETPLLDIKPYVMDFDRPTGLVVSGWLQAPLAQLKEARSDSRFDSSLQEGEG